MVATARTRGSSASLVPAPRAADTPNDEESMRKAVLRQSAVVSAGARFAWQPIVSLSTGEMTAVEALARFPTSRRRRGRRTTEAVLGAARRGGYAVPLELECLRSALALRHRVPEGAQVFINLSPEALHALSGAPALVDDLHGVVVEVTEHTAADEHVLADDLAVIRARGAAIAVDDVGSGYAGLLRVASMRPDYVKVDRQIVAGVGDSITQAAVLEALVTLAHRLGAEVIAEGVERLSDIAELARFDVDHVQGYAVARPRATVDRLSPAVIDACRAARRSLFVGSAVFASTAGRTRRLYSLTAALAGIETLDQVAETLKSTAAHVGVDCIALSTLQSKNTMREVAHAGATMDCSTYCLDDYPATVEVMRTGNGLEVQADDPLADPAERRVMHELGWASMLMVPIHDEARAFGILEFANSTPRRWSAQDIAHARGLAEHLAAVMARLSLRNDGWA